MRLLRNVALSRKALWQHRMRTALALAGTAVGVAAVLAMLAVGEGAERRVLDRIDGMGRNLLTIMPGGQRRVAGRAGARGATVTTLVPADGEAIVAESDLVARVAPSQGGDLPLEYADRATTATVRGTTPDYFDIRNFSLVAGRPFTREENRAGLRVAVIGARVRERLFPDADPIGETLRVRRIPFEVIGVLGSKGVSLGGSGDEDNQVVIPLNTAQRRVFNRDYLGMIFLEVASPQMMEAAAGEVSAILRERHRLDRLGKPDDFVVRNQRVVIVAEMEAMRSFRRMAVGLGAVALAVGSVGILSIMLLSVRERRGEIGLRTAVGARRRDIWLQFLIESLTLGGTGGAVGVALGLGLAWAIGAFTEWRTAVTLPAVILAMLSALIVGVGSGVYPAGRAAAWDPIEALRSQ